MKNIPQKKKPIINKSSGQKPLNNGKKNNGANKQKEEQHHNHAQTNEYVDTDIADATEGFGGGEVMSAAKKKRR